MVLEVGCPCIDDVSLHMSYASSLHSPRLAYHMCRRCHHRGVWTHALALGWRFRRGTHSGPIISGAGRIPRPLTVRKCSGRPSGALALHNLQAPRSGARPPGASRGPAPPLLNSGSAAGSADPAAPGAAGPGAHYAHTSPSPRGRVMARAGARAAWPLRFASPAPLRTDHARVDTHRGGALLGPAELHAHGGNPRFVGASRVHAPPGLASGRAVGSAGRQSTRGLHPSRAGSTHHAPARPGGGARRRARREGPTFRASGAAPGRLPHIHTHTQWKSTTPDAWALPGRAEFHRSRRQPLRSTAGRHSSRAPRSASQRSQPSCPTFPAVFGLGRGLPGTAEALRARLACSDRMSVQQLHASPGLARSTSAQTRGRAVKRSWGPHCRARRRARPRASRAARHQGLRPLAVTGRLGPHTR